jgi:drug/metabolite transporter (DMT)-like permease
MRQIPGQIYLWLAVLIFGASSAVTRKITEIGTQNFVGGQNPISLCNVLFVGNLCALLVLLLIHRQQWNRELWSRLSRREWLGLVMVATLSGTLAPGLIFQALSLTPVTNVVLVSRLEPPLTLALSVWLLHDRVNGWQIMGAIAAFLGVALTVILQPVKEPLMQMAGFHLGVGELLAALGAVALAVATILGKKRLSKVPLGIFSIVRTGLGTMIFFIVALILYGQDHFMEAFSPFLWKWMLLYGAIIVVLGQSFWMAGFSGYPQSSGQSCLTLAFNHSEVSRVTFRFARPSSPYSISEILQEYCQPVASETIWAIAASNLAVSTVLSRSCASIESLPVLQKKVTCIGDCRQPDSYSLLLLSTSVI